MKFVRSKNNSIAVILVGVVALMTGVAYLSVPLYELFCQVTGFGGTPRIVANATTTGTTASHSIARKLDIRFNVDVANDLPWHFTVPEVRRQIPAGQPIQAIFRARNTGSTTVTGVSTYNVTPHKSGPYVQKIECFCFTEQTLRPGQEVEMPVTFMIDAEMYEDRDTKELSTITLSYSFFVVKES